MATPSLRPLSVGEILDAGIKVCTRHWKQLALCVVVPVLPLAILQVLLIASLDPEQLELNPESTATTLDDVETGFWVGSGISTVLQVVLYLVVNAACFKAVADAWLGAEPSAGRSLRFGLKSAGRVFLLGLVFFPALVLGFVACIVPGVWLFVIWSLAVPALLFERLGPFKALGRSNALVDNRFWGTFLLLLVSALLVGFLGGIITAIPSAVAEIAAPENHLAASVANVVGTTVGNVVTYPYSAAVVAILYFDQRVRKEGFDVQMLAEGLGARFDPDAPIPAPLQPGPYTGPPPQGWQPQGQYGGWNVPSHDAPPLRWGPGAQQPPQDTRPPDESPWMSPPPGGWAPPTAGQGPPPPPASSPPEDEATRWGTPQTPSEAVESRWSAPTEGASPSEAVESRWGKPAEPPMPPADEATPSPVADDDAPTDPLPASPEEERAWESRWGAQSPFGESPWQDGEDEEKRKRDKDRADWQPPEEPRGPGGL